MSTDVFDRYESEVRSYCRAFPVVMQRAKGAEIFTEDGKRYIDFFAGAGALNYGHNPDFIKRKLIAYLEDDNIIHALDMFTVAKREFLVALNDIILKPRGLNYKTQFTGPTGTNAVEAALKIARKVKQRPGIFAFQGGFHGMTLGSLAATGNQYNRGGAGVPLGNVTFMPYPHGFNKSIDTIAYIDNVLSDSSSGIDKPAAILLETIQAEGGVIVADVDWLIQLRHLCDKHDVLMIVDDIQVGCGRSGTFFSFERACIQPDIVTLSKSIGGYGVPTAIVLLKPELDLWKPGEHNGTFRGNQMAFVAGAEALSLWKGDQFAADIAARAGFLESFIQSKLLTQHSALEHRGLGLIQGVDLTALDQPELVEKILAECFENGLILENAGRKGQVVKFLPPLNIDMDLLEEGCAIVDAAFRKYVQR